jgi:hypothetical protein
MSTRDYLAEAEVATPRAELDQHEYIQALIQLGIGQQLRRIADQMEPHTVQVAEGVVAEAQFPNLQIRAYLAREGRL